MSFYRIYRPKVLDEIDNIAIARELLALLTKPKKDLPHAYLFTGPRGAGKTTAARIIAKLFNCIKPLKSGAPCGACDNCKEISDGRYIDVLEIDAASNRGIDEIRELRNGISLTPVSGLYKVYIIDEVHMLTTEAFNALLKTLEEPPAHAVFVLATTDAQKVPATIKSRCLCLTFAKASTKELIHALSRIVTKEKIDIDNDALEAITTHVDGSFRDAVKLLEQVSFQKGKITSDVVMRMLSLSTDTTVAQFLKALNQKDTQTALDIIEDSASKGSDIKIFITQCLETLQKQLLREARGELKIDQIFLRKSIDALVHAYDDVKISPIPQLPLELAVVELCEASKTSNTVLSNTSSHPDFVSGSSPIPKQVRDDKQTMTDIKEKSDIAVTGDMLTLERLTECWPDVIEATKPFNHSVAGFLRSTRPKSIKDGIVTMEAFYSFHKEKLSEVKTRETLGEVFRKLFGVKVKVEVVLGKK